LRTFLALAWFLFLVIAMLTPGSKLPNVAIFDYQDKVIHLICFFIQGYLWSGVGVKKHQVNLKNRIIWKNFLVFGFLTGILLEVFQQIVPNRSFEIIDMIFNALGAIFGLWAYFKWPFIKFILE
jgi:VanZ family protein